MMSKGITANFQFISPLLHHSTSKPNFTLISNCTYTSTNKPSPSPANIEIRVCTNRTCRKQGSFHIFETLLGISPPHVFVNSCGCLGRCGRGPNLVVLPPAAMVSYCGTAARAADLMVDVCGGGGDDDGVGVAKRSLDSLALRKRGEVQFQRQNFADAELLLSQAIEAKPIGGIHIAYKSRSAVRLASGNFSGALEDVKEALVYAPQYAEAHVCHGDILLALDQLVAAEEVYALALEINPSLRRSKDFKARVQILQEKVASAAMS